MQRFSECCDNQEIEDEDSFTEPKFVCVNCGEPHETPIKERTEYIELEDKYKELRTAFIERGAILLAIKHLLAKETL